MQCINDANCFYACDAGTKSKALLTLCEGNSSVIIEFPSQRPVRRSVDVLFDLRLNKRLDNNLDAGDLRRYAPFITSL